MTPQPPCIGADIRVLKRTETATVEFPRRVVDEGDNGQIVGLDRTSYGDVWLIAIPSRGFTARLMAGEFEVIK